MTDEHANWLVLRDGAGALYLLSEADLERARVSREHVAEIEYAINAADDTKGYFTLVESPSAAQRGTQSVLIGLLLPAVQLSAARQMGDGSVRLAR